MIKYSSLYDFEKYYKDRKIVCLGAGKRFERIIENFDWNIVLCIDNDKEKQGKRFESAGRVIQVRDWDYLVKKFQPDWVLMITPAKYEEFVFDLMDNTELSRCETFIFSKFDLFKYDDERMNYEKKDIIFKQTNVQMIPKKIHFFWFSNDEYPDDVLKCIDSWKKYCPDYEIIKWDLDNYYSDNIFFKEAIQEKKWAFASDFARADIIYREGGIYLDSDVELVANLDVLLYQNAFIGFEDNKKIDPGSGFGAAKGNRIIKKFVDIYDDKNFILPDGQYNIIPCPEYYTSVLVNEGIKLNGTFQRTDDITVYPVSVLCPHSYNTNILYLAEETLSVHRHLGSWLSEDASKQLLHRYNEIGKRYIKK